MIDPRPIDILDGSFYLNDPYPAYAWLRSNAPAYYDDTNELWVITRYDDVVAIERDKKTFINSDQNKGGYRPNIPADQAIIGLDDPLHTARRSLVARRFTPRAVSTWEEHVSSVVDSLLDAALAKGEIEVVEDLAAPLPAMMIGLLLGFPHEMWPKLRDWSERSIALGGGPRYYNDDGIAAVFEFTEACIDLYETKSKCPADDVMSLWVDVANKHGEVGGSNFGLDQVISDCLLLLDGGAETTRTVLARAIVEMARNPQLLSDLKRSDSATATEEFIRWVTPIHNMARVTTRDVHLAGKDLRAGDQLLLMYSSANRDERYFTDPNKIDLSRSPNNHLAFGFGTHFCLGASLARLEIRLFLEKIAQRVEGLEAIQDRPHRELPSAFVYGLLESHVRIHG